MYFGKLDLRWNRWDCWNGRDSSEDIADISRVTEHEQTNPVKLSKYICLETVPRFKWKRFPDTGEKSAF